MGKICSNCGKELSDNAKFCSKCGSKCEEVVQEKKVKRMCQKCGHELDEKMKFCPKCGTGIKTVESRDKSKIEQVTEMASSGVMQAGSALTEGVEKSREKFNEIQNMSKEERKERAKQCVNTAKEKGAEFAGDVKDFKNLPKRKRKKVIVTLCGIVIALFIITRFIGNEPKEPHKYVGILFCGKCGTAMRKRYLASHESYDGYMCGFHQKMGEKYCELNHITFEKLDELVAFAINQQLKHLKCDLKQLEKQYQQNKSENMTSLTKIETKINRNREYQKKAYEQFMDEVLSKEEYLELKQMYDTENQQLQIEMSKRQEAKRNRQKTIEETTVWLQRLGQKKITTKQLTRDVLVELIEKIYVFPKQELDIHFKFVNPLLKVLNPQLCWGEWCKWKR